MNEPFAHGLTRREEGQMEFLGKTPNGLSASATLPAADGQCQYYFGELPNPRIDSNEKTPSGCQRMR